MGIHVHVCLFLVLAVNVSLKVQGCESEAKEGTPIDVTLFRGYGEFQRPAHGGEDSKVNPDMPSTVQWTERRRIDAQTDCALAFAKAPITTKLNSSKDEALLKETSRVQEKVVCLYVARGYQFHAYQKGGSRFGDALKLNSMSTGGAMEWSDVELFVSVARFLSPRNIFGVGNAFGFSTLILSSIFDTASVDIIDCGCDGKDNVKGIDLTNRIANDEGMNIRVTRGWSPKDVPKASRSKLYELVFLDGRHQAENLRQDFNAILRFMAKRCVIVCHDVHIANGLAKMIMGRLGPEHPEFTYVNYHGVNYKNKLGTGFFFRGFSSAEAASIKSLGDVCTFSRRRKNCDKDFQKNLSP